MDSIYGANDMITGKHVSGFSTRLAREARPDAYTGWLMEGLIKFGESQWFDITSEMDANTEWPFVQDKTEEGVYCETGCMLGHIQIEVDSENHSMVTRRRMRIMPKGKEFIDYQSKESDMTK